MRFSCLPRAGQRGAFARALPTILLMVMLGLALFLQPRVAHAVAELRTLIDVDGNPATGCNVVTPAGVFQGAEQAAVTRIDLAAPSPVGDVSREVCQGGALVADPSFVPLAPLQWPAGIDAAGPQVDVVESYTRLVAPPTSLRLGFTASTTDSSFAPSALLAVHGAAGGGPVMLTAAGTPTVSVPVLGSGGLLLLACVLALATYRFAPARRVAATGSALCLAFAVGLAWSALVRDGEPSDWVGTAPIAAASTTGPFQIAAVYAQLQGGTLHLRYDLDLGVRDGTLQDDGPYATTVGTPLPVAAPGLLANDTLGTPAIEVREFRVQGSPTTTPVGGAVAFAGSTLTVNADGGFTMGAPTAQGLFRFEYRARNRFKNGGWGLATVAVGAAVVCGDGARAGAEACDDGNTVSESNCAYGTVSCTACNANCSAQLNLLGNYCGDNAINGPELCDDGNNTTETSCAYGTASCTACNANCTAPLSLVGGFCGDNAVNGPEACDDGNNTTETSCAYGTVTCTACNASCTAPLTLAGGFCGDTMVNGPEACDDGNNTTETSCPYGSPSCSACNASCSAPLNLTGPFCGDGIVNGPEACDGTAGCTPSCTY